MDKPTCDVKRQTLPDKDGKVPHVTMRSDELIDILKTLEGLKRKFQTLLKA